MVIIKLSRPETGNRIDLAMAEELRDACRQCREDDAIGLVMLTGSGGVFATGRETPKIEPSNDSAQHAGSRREWLARMQIASEFASLPPPVLVSIEGEATGHGLELALAGDLRIASSQATFGLMELTPENFPWDGATQRLPRLVGPAWAKDLILTGRKIDAREALEIGLVNRVVEDPAQLVEQANELAQAIASGGPIAARYAKEAVQKGMDLTLNQGLALEADLNVILQSTEDREEGIKSFLERRSPNFSNR